MNAVFTVETRGALYTAGILGQLTFATVAAASGITAGSGARRSAEARHHRRRGACGPVRGL